MNLYLADVNTFLPILEMSRVYKVIRHERMEKTQFGVFYDGARGKI